MSEPTNIHEAIVAVKAGVKRLEKAGLNAFDKYNFTSIDDFKDHMRPLLAKYGLYETISETSFETVLQKNSKGEEKVQCKIAFDVWLTYKDGVKNEPSRITILLPYTGAQASGIASSYALKVWFKGQFLASSGDADEEADARRQDEYGAGEILSKKDAKPLFEALQRELRSVAIENNSDALLAWASDNRSQYMSLPVDWRDEVKREYAETLATIKAGEKMDSKK